MAQRVSPAGRVPGNPLGGVLRDLSRKSRPTSRGASTAVLVAELQRQVDELDEQVAALVTYLGRLEQSGPSGSESRTPTE